MAKSELKIKVDVENLEKVESFVKDAKLLLGQSRDYFNELGNWQGFVNRIDEFFIKYSDKDKSL